MTGKLFSLFKRGKVWYVRFKKPDKTFSTARSTQKTNRYEAEQFAIDLLRRGKIAVPKKLSFEEFSHNFFDIKGPWAIDRLSRGHHVRERYCINMTRTLKNRVNPYFGNMNLADIDVATIKAFRSHLFANGYAGATINLCLIVVKQILQSAEEQSLIHGIPRIDSAATNTKHKDILTVDEVKKLFEVEWINFRGYAASLLSSITGLRLGEVLGLVISDFHPEDKFIHCRRSWDYTLRTLSPTTKTGRARNVFIPNTVIDVLNRLIESNPYPKTKESFIFYADKSSSYPTEPKIITKSFYDAMHKIGITEEMRRSRNITFHSHRHFLNSLLINSNIPLQKIQSITGHLTAEMTQHYYHADDMEDVRKVQDQLFA